MNKFLACLVLIVVFSSAQGFSIWEKICEKTKMVIIHGWEHVIKPELKKTGENIKNEIKQDAIEKSKRFCLQDLEEDKSKARCLAILKILNII